MKLNRFIKIDFTCDNCYQEFERDIIYSLAPSLNELGDYSHYCAECAVVVEKQTSSKKTKKNPVRQQNRRKKTGRTYLIGIRGTKE